MNDPQTYFGLIHDIWDGFGFGVLAAITLALIFGNIAMVIEWFSKRKQAKDEIQNDNSK